MLLHRDYLISAPWRVMMFKNRIKLSSPGALPNYLTVENIRNGVSNTRNPQSEIEMPSHGSGLPLCGQEPLDREFQSTIRRGLALKARWINRRSRKRGHAESPENWNFAVCH